MQNNYPSLLLEMQDNYPSLLPERWLVVYCYPSRLKTAKETRKIIVHSNLLF